MMVRLRMTETVIVLLVGWSLLYNRFVLPGFHSIGPPMPTTTTAVGNSSSAGYSLFLPDSPPLMLESPHGPRAYSSETERDPGRRTVPGITNSGENRSFCSGPEGSLHRIALDMIHHSSPPGSLSYEKLKHVLQLNPSFYIDLGFGRIFKSNRESVATMLMGYGLTRETKAPPANNADPSTNTNNTNHVTLVESLWTESSCPLQDDNCANRSRIFVQSEQYLKPRHIGRCHESPNCIVLEFSDHNYRKAQTEGWGDSFVLLPVMVQHPSRFAAKSLEPKTIKPLRERLYDVVFFGSFTSRRKDLSELSERYLRQHPNRTNTLRHDMNIGRQAFAYGEAKVCLVKHAFHPPTGGEYHRLSELAPFGCIPVMENFADEIGIERYRECGGVVFASPDDLFGVAATVTAGIDRGCHGDAANHARVDWWKAGIQWERILPAIFQGHGAKGPPNVTLL